MEPLANLIRNIHLQWGSHHADQRAGDVGLVKVGMILQEAGYPIGLAQQNVVLTQTIPGVAERESVDDLIALLVDGQLIGPRGEDNWKDIAHNKCAASGFWRFNGIIEPQVEATLEDSWVVQTDMFDRVPVEIVQAAEHAGKGLVAALAHRQIDVGTQAARSVERQRPRF